MAVCNKYTMQGEKRNKRIENDLRDFYVMLYLILIALAVTSHK